MLEFFIQNSIYVVLVIVLIIWSGIFVYLLRLDRKLTELEKALAEKEQNKR